MIQRYSLLQVTLHWLIALLIIAAFIMGVNMTEMRISPTKLQLYNYHKWLGVTILGLVAVRLLSRLLLSAPALPDTMANWEKKIAAITHFALYFLMFAIPISGYLFSSAAGYPVVFLGLIELPTLIGPSPELKEVLKETHEVLAQILMILFFAHVAAALKHMLINKDGIMKRMSFWR